MSLKCFTCDIMRKFLRQSSHTFCLAPTNCTKEEEIIQFLRDNPKLKEWLDTINLHEIDCSSHNHSTINEKKYNHAFTVISEKE